jgi:hypothetical protein
MNTFEFTWFTQWYCAKRFWFGFWNLLANSVSSTVLVVEIGFFADSFLK